MTTNERDAFEAWYAIAEGNFTYTTSREIWLAAWQAARAAPPAAPQVSECSSCHGSGQVFMGTSGDMSDGNAPVYEPCIECDYVESLPQPEPPAAIYTPGHEETYPLAYIGAVQLARQLGYKFVATDHLMKWVKP